MCGVYCSIFYLNFISSPYQLGVVGNNKLGIFNNFSFSFLLIEKKNYFLVRVLSNLTFDLRLFIFASGSFK